MSNIEEDIKFIKKLIDDDSIEIKGISCGKQFRILRTIENILAEREQDKKRIKELEEENKIYVLNGDNVNLEIYIQNNYIPVQKVIDKIEELENAERETIRENWHYIYSIQLKILEELLEEK